MIHSVRIVVTSRREVSSSRSLFVSKCDPQEALSFVAKHY